MTTQAPERPAETAAPKRGRMLWMIALIVILIIAVVVGVWFLVSDEGTPTATFDGEVATYDGPTTLKAGSVTFTFDASRYEPGVAFVVGEITDATITFEDLEAWTAVNPAQDVPDFIGTFDVTLATSGDQIVEKDITLDQGIRYGVFANTAPNDTDRAYPAVILEVE